MKLIISGEISGYFVTGFYEEGDTHTQEEVLPLVEGRVKIGDIFFNENDLKELADKLQQFNKTTNR